MDDDCPFEPTAEPGYFRCPLCGFGNKQPWTKPAHRNCPALTGKGQLFALPDLPCPARGRELRQVRCQLCGGEERLVPVFACTKHGECALARTQFGSRGEVRQCFTCGDRPPDAAPPPLALPRPTVRELIYHVCPLESNDLWRQNVRQLVRRGHVFNGRRVIAVATGPGLASLDAVRAEFGVGFAAEFLPLANDVQLREVASFPTLLEKIADPQPDRAVFFAHTKGNSTSDSVRGSIYWRNAAYHHLLDRVDECLDQLQTHAAVGIHKIVWPVGQRAPYPSRLNAGHWMLAGTFFWFRADLTFAHPNWRQVPRDRYGAEAWLSTLFPHQHAASMFQLWPELQYPTPNPYNPAIYPDPIPDED